MASLSATASRSPTRSSATASPPSCSCRPGRSSTRAPGRCRFLSLSRHYRVITLDGRGNGRSGRPPGADSYLSAEYAADAVAVMDATGTDRAVVVSFSRGASYALHLGAARPERVLGHVFICPTTPLAPFAAPRLPYVKRFEETLDDERRLGQRQRAVLGAGLPRVPGILLLPGIHRAAFDQAREDGVTWGWRRHPRRSRIRDAEPSAKRDAAWRHCSPPCSALAWSSREPRTPSPGPRPARSWPKPWAAGPGWSSWPGRVMRRIPATPSRSTCSSASS